MSASLVGSEMCIRDSFSRERPPTAPLAGRGFRGAPDGPAQSPTGRGERCLLYTSDAADDM
eukprot:7972556-Alexandrium_andersonii.AAC.1